MTVPIGRGRTRKAKKKRNVRKTPNMTRWYVSIPISLQGMRNEYFQSEIHVIEEILRMGCK
jgi:hypothetical protein